MTESEVLNIIKNYLSGHGLMPKRINPKHLPPGKKSPDFEVYEGSTYLFLCEVKSPDLKLHEATQMYQWNTTISKLREFISRARKQLEDYDPGHTLPWVVIFTSSNIVLNWKTFSDCIYGAVIMNGEVIKDMSSQRFVIDTQEDMKSIDFFIWFQINENDKRIYQFVPFPNVDSKYPKQMSYINKLLRPKEVENIVNWATKKYKKED